jgi:SAM-dependent methyltransferase
MRKGYNTKGLIDFYAGNVNRYKNDIKAVAWGSRESQEKRFEVLTQIALLDGEAVLDVGCGLGDFYIWLKYKYSDIRYTGIDITPSMIETALKNYLEARFYVQDILELEHVKPSYDYVFTSGIFNRRIPRHKHFVMDMIARMFELCRKGIAFNIMSTRADFMEEGEYYADPAKMLDFCLSISRKAALRHDYMPHDFTVYLYK